MKWRVFVADDHAVVRRGIVLLIETQTDMEVVGEAGDGETAWRQIRELLPDVAIVDISLPVPMAPSDAAGQRSISRC